MQTNEKRRFDRQYQKHLTALKLQNMSASAQDVYARAVRRVSAAYDCCPDRLTPDDLRDHFAALIDSHSWSTVRSDRAGLQFFFKHVIKKPMDWGAIVKPKRVQSLPDVITHTTGGQSDQCHALATLRGVLPVRLQHGSASG